MRSRSPAVHVAANLGSRHYNDPALVVLLGGVAAGLQRANAAYIV
jgi:hypothetical protein